MPTELQDRIEACVATVLPPRDPFLAPLIAAGGDIVLRLLPRTLANLDWNAVDATIRTAALINGSEALTLLSGYAADENRAVQASLCEAWALFDPEKYARQVLADAPLVEGDVTVSNLPQARAAARHLRHLTSLGARVPATEFGQLDQYPSLTRLEVTSGHLSELVSLQAQPKIQELILRNLARVTDYSPLGSLRELERLALYGCRKLKDLDFLAGATKLRNLFIGPTGTMLDLSPLAGRSGLSLELSNSQQVIGREALEANVKIHWRPTSWEGFDTLSTRAHYI